MENEEKVYGYVKAIADEQFAKNEKISRADVAFILKDKYGVACVDGAALSGCIYRAYVQLGRPASIVQSIMTNSGDKSVVEQYELNARLDGGDLDKAFVVVDKDLSDAQKMIVETKRQIADVLQLDLAQSTASLQKWLQGTKGIDEVKSKSAALMQNYGNMVDCYKTAEEGVRNDIHDFVELRGEVNNRFMKYANALVDVFGDAIKVVAPNLFDFDGVKYLDAASMQKSAQLEYDKLNENCTLLLGEIATHYESTVSQLPVWLKASKSMGSKGGLYGSLVAGAVSYLNHWLNAQEKTVQMKKDYVQFEESVKRDRRQLEGDLLRLTTIHKVMNDLYIPRAVTFSRRSDEVMSDDLSQLLNSLYTGEVAPLVAERDRLLARFRELERSINDHNENLVMFDSQIVNLKGLIESQKANYEEAESRKPAEPGLLKRFFTLGVAQRNYGRRLLEWDEQNGELVSAYEDAVMDLDEGMEDRENHSVQLEADKREYEACKAKLTELNREIAAKISCSPQQKAEALKHLRNILTLLQAGKTIVESKLDDSLLDVVVPTRLEEVVPLSTDVEQRLHGFVSDVCSDIKGSGGTVSAMVLRAFGLSDGDVSPDLSLSSALAVDKASELLKNWSYLQSDKMKAQLNDVVYNREMDKMKREFQTVMAELNEQGASLMEVMKRVNTAVEKDDLRRALSDLSGSSACELSEQDFDDILAGKKQIEI